MTAGLLRLSRRAFGRAVAGLTVAFTLAPGLVFGQAKKLPGSLLNNRRLDGWLRVEPDGAVTVFTGKVELGQGILTALSQIAADELDLPFERVRMVSGSTAETPDEGHTAGSQSIEYSGTAIRYAAAEARRLLLERAAERLGQPIDSLVVEDGVVLTADRSRHLGYGELAGGDLLQREASAMVPPKPAVRRRIAGQPIPRLDLPAKFTGGAIYVQDLRLTGMLHGRVVHPPAYHADLLSLDESAVRRLPGVIAVVRDGRFLGVVAEREEQAIAARAALQKAARWSHQASLPRSDRLHQELMGMPADTSQVNSKGDPTKSTGGRRLEASYTRPCLAHASIGPSCAVARFGQDRLTVWSHTQGVFPLRRDLARVLGMAEGAITVIHGQGSGCYGHNGADDVALDAALLSRAVDGRPVRVQWMRDDEFAWEPFGSAMVVRVAAELGADGGIVNWSHDIWSNTHSNRPGSNAGTNLLSGWHLSQPVPAGPPKDIPQPNGGGDRNSIPLYEFPNQLVRYHLVKEMPLRVSALRALGAYANIFAIESFMDELAAAAGIDPLAFRLRHLKDERARAVLQAAVDRAGAAPPAAGDGLPGRGLAFAQYKNHAAYVAVVADVAVNPKDGALRVKRTVVAVDAGEVINPDGLRNQIEGGVIQSTSWSLKEQVRFDREGVTSRDWVSYPILTFAEMPEVEVVVLDRPDQAPLGAGEAAQGPTVAAIANAFARATGRRLRDLPFSPDRVRKVMA